MAEAESQLTQPENNQESNPIARQTCFRSTQQRMYCTSVLLDTLRKR